MIRVIALLLALICVFTAGCAKVVEKDVNKPAVPSKFSLAQAVYPEIRALLRKFNSKTV